MGNSFAAQEVLEDGLDAYGSTGQYHPAVEHPCEPVVRSSCGGMSGSEKITTFITRAKSAPSESSSITSLPYPAGRTVPEESVDRII